MLKDRNGVVMEGDGRRLREKGGKMLGEGNGVVIGRE